MAEFLIESVTSSTPQVSTYTEFIQSESEDCEQCYGPVWATLGVFLFCFITLSIIAVINCKKSQ